MSRQHHESSGDSDAATAGRRDGGRRRGHYYARSSSQGWDDDDDPDDPNDNEEEEGCCCCADADDPQLLQRLSNGRKKYEHPHASNNDAGNRGIGVDDVHHRTRARYLMEASSACNVGLASALYREDDSAEAGYDRSGEMGSGSGGAAAPGAAAAAAEGGGSASSVAGSVASDTSVSSTAAVAGSTACYRRRRSLGSPRDLPEYGRKKRSWSCFPSEKRQSDDDDGDGDEFSVDDGGRPPSGKAPRDPTSSIKSNNGSRKPKSEQSGCETSSSNDDIGNDGRTSSSSSSFESILNDTKLIGKHKLLTLESAHHSIHLVAEFIRDEEEAGESVTFRRSFFLPLWQRLKDQGSSSSPGSSSSIRSNSCRWKHVPSRDPLANFVFVPPNSKLGARGKSGMDYYITEEHVAFDVLEDVRLISESLSESFAQNARYFSMLLPILDWAVREDVEYEHARRERCSSTLLSRGNVDSSSGGICNGNIDNWGGTPNKKRRTRGSRSISNNRSGGNSSSMRGNIDSTGNSGIINGNIGSSGSSSTLNKKKLRGRGGGRNDHRSRNYSSFGLEDCAQRLPTTKTDTSDEFSEIGKTSPLGEETNGYDPNDGKEDGNQDECAICGDGGELICCDNCDKAYHATCLQVEPETLPDPWHCPSCVNNDDNNGNKKVASHLPEDQQNGMEPASNDNGFDKSAILQNDDDNVMPPCNLIGVEPKVFMPIEILDRDYIWNMAQIVGISYGNDQDQTNPEGKQNSCGPNAPLSPICHVTVRREGWGEEWDETLPYPNSRLARIFTYTKKVKCLVALFDEPLDMTAGDLLLARSNSNKNNNNMTEPRKDNNNNIANWTDVWPCTVTFRMPHPDQNETSEAFKCLREDNTQIFVHPYSTDLLPKSVQRQMMHGGKWVSEKKLRPWKDLDVKNPKASPAGNPILCELPSKGRREGEEASASSAVDNMAYYFVQNFSKAYRAAQSDYWIRGRLPSNALLGGALLKDEYRVSNVGGGVVDGVKYTGSFPTKEGGDQIRIGSIPSLLAFGATQSGLKAASDVVDLTKSDDSAHNLPASKVPFVPAPFLPPPIPMKDVAYPGQGVRRLPDSNRWAGILRGPGNDIFLGSYTSQSEAAYAVKLASAQSKAENSSDMVGTTKESEGQIKSTLHLPHFPNFQEKSPFGSNAGRVADLMNTPIESIVSAFEETQQLTSNQKQSSQPRFRLRDWMAQHHKHVQHLKDLSPMSAQNVCDNFPLIVKVKDSGSVSRKRRKQSTPKRLHTSTTAGKQNNCN